MALADRGSREAERRSGAQQGAVPGHDDKVAVTRPISGRQVDSVVATQPMDLGELTGAPCEFVVDFHDMHLRAAILQSANRRLKLWGGEPSDPMGLSHGGACLGIQQANTQDPDRFVPQLTRSVRARFVDEQRHDC